MQDNRVIDPGRRTFLARALKTSGAIALGPALWEQVSLADLGPLQPPDTNGIRLPPGFSSRAIARSDELVRRDTGWLRLTTYPWHVFPDGGATFPADDGGWVYVSNSEIALLGGAGAIRFDRYGRIVDAYPILKGTNTNCAGGPTPWRTWLSCEESSLGRVFECDPFGRRLAVERPALGRFMHEAAAVDSLHQRVYLTEDENDGRLYRFTPYALTSAGHPDLSSGLLEVAIVDGTQQVVWAPLPNPTPGLPGLLDTPTRHQVPESTSFDGGEGIWYHEGVVYFTTKGTNQVWALDTASQHLEVIYDAATAREPMLTGVDNVTVSANGDVLVAEDGGDMQIVVLRRSGEVKPLLMVENQSHSEITGPAFSPDGSRLYFSSQRGPANPVVAEGFGITYEVTGPFLG